MHNQSPLQGSSPSNLPPMHSQAPNVDLPSSTNSKKQDSPWVDQFEGLKESVSVFSNTKFSSPSQSEVKIESKNTIPSESMLPEEEQVNVERAEEEMPDLEKRAYSPSRASRLQDEGHQMNRSLSPVKHLSKIPPSKSHVLSQAESSQILPPKNEVPQSVSIKREVFSSHSETEVVSHIADDLKIDQQQSLAVVRAMTSAMAALSDPAKLKGQSLTKQEGDFLARLGERNRTFLAQMLSNGPLLCAMTFGGSRVRGNSHAKSDLDIGVEVFQDPRLMMGGYDQEVFRNARSALEVALLERLVACGTSEVPVEKGIKIQPGYQSKNISTIHDPTEFFLRSGQRTSPLRHGETEKPSFSSSGAHSYFFDGAGCYGRLQIKGDHPPSGLDEKQRLIYPRDQREAYQKQFPCV